MRKFQLLIGVLLSGASFTAHPVLAQSGDAQTGDAAANDANTIIVTAERRSQNLQDVPISISAFTGEQLETKRISGIADLQAAVPNVQLTPFPNAVTSQRIFIRGIGNVTDDITQDPSVAVYVDGIYTARIQGQATEVADLERIEVLRGPQGSLYGRNATGGAINFITKAPQFGELSGSLRGTVGNYDLFEGRASTNLPLGDKVAVQLGYMHSQKNGFVRNLGTGAKRFGDRKRDAYRFALRWAPVEGLDIRYSYDRSKVGDTAQYTLTPVPFYPEKAARPSESSPYVRDLAPNDITAQGHSLIVAYDVSDHLQLKSLTGYRKMHVQYNNNYAPGIFGPFPANRNQFFQKQHQFSQELQMIGDLADGQLEYVGGLYYFEESAKGYDTARIFNFNFANPGLNFAERFVTARNEAYAAYAQATYSPDGLDRRLHVTVGARYSHDKREGSYQRNVTNASGVQTIGSFGEGVRKSEDFSPSLTVAYEITPQINAYGKVVRAYKTGGFNVGSSSLATFIEGFGPEKVISYEAGLKSEFFDRAVRLNAAAFWMDYSDIQVPVQDPVVATIVDIINAGKSRIKGFEVDLNVRPMPGLMLTVNYGYLDAKFTEVLDTAGNDVTALFPFLQAPENTLSVSADYEIASTTIGTLSANISYSYVDKQFSQSRDKRYIIPSYGLLDGRLTLAEIPFAGEQLKLSLWGKNLTDKEYYAYHGNSFVPSAQFGSPRSYGVDLAFEF